MSLGSCQEEHQELGYQNGYCRYGSCVDLDPFCKGDLMPDIDRDRVSDLLVAHKKLLAFHDRKGH